jgi:hypothetical protein
MSYVQNVWIVTRCFFSKKTPKNTRTRKKLRRIGDPSGHNLRAISISTTRGFGNFAAHFFNGWWSFVGFIFSKKRAHHPPSPTFLIMRLALLLLVCCPWVATAQTTLIKGAPTETYDLACATCTISVTELALVRGHQVMPYNLTKKPPTINLLHWEYFDKFLGKRATYPRPLYGEDCVQLINDLGPNDTVSLHINLAWKPDTSGTTHHFFFVIGGLLRQDLERTPIQTAYTDDLFSPQRFAAIAQVTNAEGVQETFQITEGSLRIEKMNLKDDRIEGYFEFFSDRVGLVKTSIFKNGVFRRE